MEEYKPPPIPGEPAVAVAVVVVGGVRVDDLTGVVAVIASTTLFPVMVSLETRLLAEGLAAAAA